jgi:hypothetical protein
MAAGSISRGFHWCVRLSIAFVLAYSVIFQVTLFLSCRPINAFWNQVSLAWIKNHHSGVDYQCTNEAGNVLAASAISIIQDFLACGLPIILFWKLKMPLRQKIALGAIFSVGLLYVSLGTSHTIADIPQPLCHRCNAHLLYLAYIFRHL